MKRLLLSLFAFGSALMGLFSCADTGKGADIIVSFYPYEYMARRLCGEKMSVSSIVPRGSEPHDFELKSSDVRALYDAKAVFLSGLKMETFEDAVVADPNLSGKTHILSNCLDNLIRVESKGTYIDPHVWLDTDQYAKMGETVLSTLISLSPSNESYFRTNYASFKQDLDGLKSYAGSRLRGKTIAVAHDAFRYMCREFGFSEIYVNGFSPDEEPTAEVLAAILDAMKEKGIDTLFVEELGNKDIAAYIATQTGCKIEVLSPLESIEEGEDFLSVYRENIDKITEARNS